MSTVDRDSALVNRGHTYQLPRDKDDWRRSSQDLYHCHLLIIREDDGTFSAVAMNLPGAGSCGDSEEEAIENAREAILGVIEAYLEAGEEIPWTDSIPEDFPSGSSRRWILVHA